MSALGLLLAVALGVTGAIAAAARWGPETEPASPAGPTTLQPSVTTTTRPAPLVADARYVAPDGDDAAPGTADRPWGTLQGALSTVAAGETLYVRGGTYTEDVHVSESEMHPGTADRPVQVLAYPGERPVVEGLLWLTNPSYWHLDGINVTWNRSNSAGDHMVQLHGGTGWRFSNAELWGARSFAALLVADGAEDFLVDRNFIHDTYASNDTNQDHLIYVDNGHDGSGVIERNILARSVNGRGVKLGPGSPDRPGTSNVIVRYNTFYDNRGPSNVQLSGSSSNNEIYGNLLDSTGDDSPNITGYQLTGSNNLVHDNLGWNSDEVADLDEDGLVDGGGNVHVDPMLADPANDDFRPQAPIAASYGTVETARELASDSGAA